MAFAQGAEWQEATTAQDMAAATGGADPSGAGQEGPRPGEGQFEPEEMFFSRTDKRGVIQAGNQVFVRTSGHDIGRLIGAPHRLIRHEDMPRGAFQVFWDHLKADRPIGAYVKNRSRAGLAYWVFALASPIPDGYLSVRIKPATDLFETVAKEYEALLARERNEGLSPEDSAAAFCDRLRELGFDDYGHFMTRALAEELQARDKVLGRKPDADLEQMRLLADRVAEVERAAGQLRQSFAEVADIPSNMQIMASRIERAGGPVSVLSINYTRMADEALQRLRDFAGETQDSDTIEMLRDGLFKLCAARIQQEMLENFGNTGEGTAQDMVAENTVLRDQNAAYQAMAQQALGKIVSLVSRRSEAARDLHRMILGLDSVRLLCRVESGRLGGDVGELSSIVTRLDRLHRDLDRQLDEVGNLAEGVAEAVSRLRLSRQGG